MNRIAAPMFVLFGLVTVGFVVLARPQRPPVAAVVGGAAVVVDQTDQIQAALDAGTPFTPGYWYFNRPLIVRKGLTGAPGVVLAYTGPPNPQGVVQIAAGSRKFELRDFYLTGGGGQGVGLAVVDYSVPLAQAQISNITFSRIRVEEFGVGFQVGDDASGRMADSLTFQDCGAARCGIGVSLQAWNSLQIHLSNCGFSTCKNGVWATQAGQVTVTSGGGSNCDTLYRFDSGANYAITGARLENVGRFLELGAGADATVSCDVTACQVPAGTTYPDGKPWDILVHGGGSLRVNGGCWNGAVRYEPTNAAATYGTVTLNGYRTAGPAVFDAAAGTRVHWTLTGCGLLDGSNRVKTPIPNDTDVVWPHPPRPRPR